MTSTVIQDVRAALGVPLTAAGFKYRPYEDFDAPTASGPVVTCTLDGATIGESYDQMYLGLGWTYILRLYQLVQVNPGQALARHDANILALLTALGADRTLGGKVASHTITDFDASYETRANERWAVAEFTVEVTPFGSYTA